MYFLIVYFSYTNAGVILGLLHLPLSRLNNMPIYLKYNNDSWGIFMNDLITPIVKVPSNDRHLFWNVMLDLLSNSVTKMLTICQEKKKRTKNIFKTSSKRKKVFNTSCNSIEVVKRQKAHNQNHTHIEMHVCTNKRYLITNPWT